MKPASRVASVIIVALAACTSKDGTSSPQAEPNGSGADGGGGTEADAAGPSDAYVQALLAARWSKLEGAPSISRGKMDDVFFTSKDVGYAATGARFAIAKTEDGGATWKDVFTKSGTYFRGVAFVDAQHGFAGNLGAGLSASITDETVLYETKDAGATWTPVTAISGPAPSGVCNLTVIDGDHLVAIGRANGPAHVMMTADRGATWTSTDLGRQMSMLIDGHFTSKDEGVVVGMKAGKPSVCTVLRTTDGGKTYTKVFASTTENSLCWKVSFPSKKVGYVAIQDTTNGPATIAKTTDGGETWVESPLPVKTNAKGAFPAIGVGFATDRIGWIASDTPDLPVYRTIDGGETWAVDDSIEAPINRFRFVDKTTAYAIGGTIWKLSIAAPPGSTP